MNEEIPQKNGFVFISLRAPIHADKIPHLENCQFHKLQDHQSLNIGLMSKIENAIHWTLLMHKL